MRSGNINIRNYNLTPQRFSSVAGYKSTKVHEVVLMDYSPYRKVLRMVAELHNRGYQRIRISPGMSPSGNSWRCLVTPVTNICKDHGAMTIFYEDMTAKYTSANEREFFGWDDCAHVAPSTLAELFISRFPEIARAGKGADWAYAGWYQEMMWLTYPNSFPIAFADWELPRTHLVSTGEKSDIIIPMPPCGDGESLERF